MRFAWIGFSAATIALDGLGMFQLSPEKFGIMVLSALVAMFGPEAFAWFRSS
jgi:hypothetical protein